MQSVKNALTTTGNEKKNRRKSWVENERRTNKEPMKTRTKKILK